MILMEYGKKNQVNRNLDGEDMALAGLGAHKTWKKIKIQG
jgi:hypothetical protein